ncbi:MAG: extracellular solute-binding protein [Microbacteriaceae bacterium]|nr:MAG: extracellular solute-binding protein [Microbacteriaceae bacterium]
MAEPSLRQASQRFILTRRSLLGGVAAAALAGATASSLAACSTPGGKSTSGAGGGASKNVSMGSYNSNPGVKESQKALVKEAEARTGTNISLNLVDHETFKSNISNYLQATPDDVFTWFAGYRMQFFAAQGLATPIDDVWEKIGANFGPAAKALSKGLDGHYYFVPMYNYPWVFFHNKSVFSDKGYTAPTSWDDLLTLAKQMKADGIVPIAFADKDLWPGCGFFDTIDLRINGYDYHKRLMRHEIPWTDPGVTTVFQQYAELLPYCQNGANGRIWQDAAKDLENKNAGMMFQGSNQVGANYAPENLPDLDFFEFPAINPKFGTDYMEAPADGYMCAAKAKNTAGGKKVLEYLGTGKAEGTFLETDKWDVGMAKDVDTSKYNAIQKKSTELIASKKAVTQFLDRDTDPAMAAAAFAGVQNFIENPSTSNIKAIQKSLEAQAKSIFA